MRQLYGDVGSLCRCRGLLAGFLPRGRLKPPSGQTRTGHGCELVQEVEDGVIIEGEGLKGPINWDIE